MCLNYHCLFFFFYVFHLFFIAFKTYLKKSLHFYILKSLKFRKVIDCKYLDFYFFNWRSIVFLIPSLSFIFPPITKNYTFNSPSISIGFFLKLYSANLKELRNKFIFEFNLELFLRKVTWNKKTEYIFLFFSD